MELLQAARIASQSCNNVIVRDALNSVAFDLERGSALKDAIARQAVFPTSVAQIFALGQQSGQMESMLHRLGLDYDRQANILATRIASTVEPLLIVILSVVVGFILFATILPILEAGNIVAM